MQKLMTCLLLALWISGFPQASHAREPVLGKVLETGRITFGYAEDRLPFSFNDQNGNPAGYSIDLCRAIAEQVRKELKLPKLDIEFIKVESSERVNALVHSRVDMDCGTATQTLTRMERVDFTFMTFVTGASMVSRRGTGSAEPSQIQGKRVAVISGTTTEEVLAQSDRSLLPDAKAEEAGRLLSHDDLFVQAAAEWALSLKVGSENMLDQPKWPAKWASICWRLRPPGMLSGNMPGI